LRIASGVRSSWLASETNVRSRANAASMRSSIALSVAPSRPISSWAGGTGRRAPGSVASIAAARARIRSTGRRAAAVAP
jgi:hypothetical protein